MVQMTILPLEQFVHRVLRLKKKSHFNAKFLTKKKTINTYPLAQTYHGPQGAAEGAAAAHAPAKQPLYVDGERLLEDGVDALDGGLKLLGGDARHQTGWELRVEAVAQAEAAHVGRRKGEFNVRISKIENSLTWNYDLIEGTLVRWRISLILLK